MMNKAANGTIIAFASSIPRAQSSLELLSQTAIEIESANSSPRLFLDCSRTSSPAMVTVASSISENLILPEIGSTTHNGDTANQSSNNIVGNKNHPQLMPRPVVDHGLAVEHHIYPSLSFSSSSCGGGSFQLVTTESSSSATTAPNNSYRENVWLHQQLNAKDSTIATLQTQVQNLTREINQLRQLPTGKISQIPLEDMLSIMRDYGSEVSDMAMPPRKSFVQKASVVRQFRRWNPHFLDWFEHVNGRWVPKLGKEGELRRRKQARLDAATHRRKRTTTPSSCKSSNPSS